MEIAISGIEKQKSHQRTDNEIQAYHTHSVSSYGESGLIGVVKLAMFRSALLFCQA